MKVLYWAYCISLIIPLLFNWSRQQTTGCNEYDLRITTQHVLEICSAGSWKRICSHRFSPANGRVACRELGYSPDNSLTQILHQRVVGPDNRVSFTCEGSEFKLALCTPILQQDLCSQQGDAGVFCREICTQGNIRLVGGYSSEEGRVEVCIAGRWGTVCDDLWDDADARVVCQQIGSYSMTRGAAALSSTFGWGSGPIHITNVQCTGTEQSLLSCQHQKEENCLHSEDAEVTCLGRTLSMRCAHSDISFTKMDESPTGLVQVCLSGSWAAICSSGWTQTEAQVVCRQLGFSAQGADIWVSASDLSYTGISISGDGCDGDEANLSQCDVQFTSTCRSTMFAGIQCTTVCPNGEIRLMGGHSNLEGRVEVCVDGRWETISDDGWSVNEATVVCRQLGHNTTGAIPFRNAAFGEGSGPIVSRRIICSGHETQLSQCNSSSSPTIFSHSEDAGVRCSCYDNTVRLMNGSTPLEGRVEVCINGTYGTVCDDNFDISDASVLCRELGYGAALQTYSNAHFGPGFGFIFVDGLRCTGNEMSFMNCNFDRHTSDCRHRDDASIVCEGLTCNERDVRLVSSTGVSLEGRVEICLHQQWGSVCDSMWDNLDAQVVCQQLGYSTAGAIAVRNSFFGHGNGPSLLNSVACNGSENLLFLCSAHQNPQLCSPDSQAGVRCQAFCADGKVRLTGGNTTYGRVEVCTDGLYRSVCADSWDDNDAAVVCRQLYQASEGAVGLRFGSGGSEPMLSCVGNGSSLLLCARSPSECVGSEEAGVQCMEGCVSGSLRGVQVDSSAAVQFLVEVCVDEAWTAVCYEGWSLTEVRIACAELGYPSMPVANYSTSASLYHHSLFVGNFTCSGSEVSLAMCSHELLSTCDRLAGVQCLGVPCVEGQLRLMDGTNMGLSSWQYDGRVEICVDGTWGTVCDDLWDNNDAQVVCNSLGFSRLGATAYSGGQYPAGIGPIKFSNTVCTGYETSLLNCSTREDHTCTHAEDAAVRCIATCSSDHPVINMLNCENGGFCALSTQDPSSFFCQCPSGFTGSRCETDMDDFCMAIDCRNGGTCMEGRGENASCICPPGFTGRFCESQVDWCQDSLCQNGGSCINRPISGVQCQCTQWYTGQFCGTLLCSSEACLNGGSCHVPDGRCSCSMGYTGQRCESSIFCLSQPCLRGGTCTEGTCVCPLGYEGTYCEQDVDNCINTICENDGTCVEEEGISTSCSCVPGYGGPTCGLKVVDVNAPCPEEVEGAWNLQFPETQPGVTISHPCGRVFPSGSTMTVSGLATRTCEAGGLWSSVNVSLCRREDILRIDEMAKEIFGQDDIQGDDVDNLVEELAVATQPQGISQFPQDLETTTSIVDKTVQFLQDDLKSTTPSQLRTQIVKVMSNALGEENIIGWNGIAEGNVGSENLLKSAEMYGNYFANALVDNNVNKSTDIINRKGIEEDNIELQVEDVNINSLEDVVFPSDVSSANMKQNGSAQSIVPRTFLLSKGTDDVSVVNILFKNLESILPRHSILASQQPATGVISTQVISNGNVTGSKGTQNATAKFQFTTRTYGSDKNVTDPACVFFKFERNLAKSTWSTEQVTTVEVISNGNNSFNVTCESQHLTSFSILVNVNNLEVSEVDNKVLNYITYIGLSISIICLLLTILFFVFIIRKKLFESVHYFIHLNLSIALILGYVTFLAGIETAVGNRFGCGFVAGLLHFFFTAAFCWMLCEGIMMYLMLVVVFSGLSKKWWFFFIIGWGPPLIIVGISAAIIHDDYGTDKYCWISAERTDGAVWAFALPMLLVIIINGIFLTAALISLYRIRRDQQKNSLFEKNRGITATVKLFWRLFVGSIILLPLLGLTWVFGLLAVSRATILFAYEFTILNSLQGFFIFFFHVIRSEKVWGKLCGKKTKHTKATHSTNDAVHTKSAGNSRKSEEQSNIVSNYKSEAIEMDEGDTSKLIVSGEDKEDEDLQ